jgi:hypothetical protein
MGNVHGRGGQLATSIDLFGGHPICSGTNHDRLVHHVYNFYKYEPAATTAIAPIIRVAIPNALPSTIKIKRAK